MGPMKTSRWLNPCLGAALIALPLATLSCSLPEPKTSFDSPNPAARTRAMARAARTGDTSHIPELIEMLDSDDPAVRMLAINTLERLTGQTLGYDHGAPPAERHRAIDRWVQWAMDTPRAGEADS